MVKVVMRKTRWLSVVIFGSMSYLVAVIMSPEDAAVPPLPSGLRAATSSTNLKMDMDVMKQPENHYAVIGAGKASSQTTPIFPVDYNTSSSEAKTFDVESENDSVALRVLKATCSFCGNVIDHLKKYGIPAATFGELATLEKSDNYQYRIVTSAYCPDCMDAIAYAEDTMYGRLLSVDEMRGLRDSTAFSQLIEAACVAGYIPQRNRPEWVFLPACEVGNSVDAKI